MGETLSINLKIATSLGDDWKTGCLIDYPYFKKLHINCIRFL